MSASLDLKSREEKDAELDKRIEALRRKNQALIKRYQEIEEDRQKAEREGVAVTGARRPRPAEAPAQPERRRAEPEAARLAGQVPPAPEDKRVLSRERKPAARGSRGGAPPGGRPLRVDAGGEGTGADSSGGEPRGRGGRGRRLRGRGGPAAEPGPDRRSQEWEERRRRNIEKMNEEMEKIAEYERSQRDGLQEKNPVRNFLDDPRRSGPFSEVNRREGSRRHIRNWGGADFDKVKTGLEQGKEQASLGRGSGRRRGLTTLDMTLSMTGRERAEYTRWKQERDQIDRERLARHRQPTGEWRREWDAEKTGPALKGGHEPGGSSGDKQECPRRPPKRPTFGEFLAGRPGDQHWNIRGRGRPRGRPSELYSMHDNRWENEEPDQTTLAPAGEDKALQAKPQVAAAAEEEEEEDEWEDVSGEEEEEEEEEANGSRDSSSEEDGPPHSCSPLPPRELSTAPPASPQEAPGTGGVPLTPLGPAEGYQPVSDWGEEMEMRSPRASSSSHRHPLAVPTEELPAGAAGVDPPVLLAMQGSLPVDPPAGGAASPALRAPEAEIKMDSEVPEPKEVAGRARRKRGEQLETDALEAVS